jgi:hypothetical protein
LQQQSGSFMSITQKEKNPVTSFIIWALVVDAIWAAAAAGIFARFFDISRHAAGASLTGITASPTWPVAFCLAFVQGALVIGTFASIVAFCFASPRK